MWIKVERKEIFGWEFNLKILIILQVYIVSIYSVCIILSIKTLIVTGWGRPNNVHEVRSTGLAGSTVSRVLCELTL